MRRTLLAYVVDKIHCLSLLQQVSQVARAALTAAAAPALAGAADPGHHGCTPSVHWRHHSGRAHCVAQQCKVADAVQFGYAGHLQGQCRHLELQFTAQVHCAVQHTVALSGSLMTPSSHAPDRR